MPDEVLNLIGDIEIGIAGAGAIVFAVSYAAFFNWRKTEAGKALMYFVWALIALFVLNALGRWTGSNYPFREIIRPAVYTALVITVWRLVWVLWRNWRRGSDRPLNIESKRSSTMSNLTPGPDHAIGVDPNVPTTRAGFLARSKKALAGGITGLLTGGVTGTISTALSDGTITGAEWWQILGFAAGGFVLGFAGVWAAPKNAD